MPDKDLHARVAGRLKRAARRGISTRRCWGGRWRPRGPSGLWGPLGRQRRVSPTPLRSSCTVPPRPAVCLFFAAFLMLFLELVLIRYLAGSVWNMGYFPNLVLLGVFIGMGLGFVCHQSVSESNSPLLVQLAAFLLSTLVIFLYCTHPIVPGFSQWVGSIGGEVYFTASPGESSTWDYVIFLCLFLSVILIFALIAQRTAK
jgi:hypothetical protein